MPKSQTLPASTFIGQSDRQQIIEAFGAQVSSGKVRFFSDVGLDFVPGRREGPYIWDLRRP